MDTCDRYEKISQASTNLKVILLCPNVHNQLGGFISGQSLTNCVLHCTEGWYQCFWGVSAHLMGAIGSSEKRFYDIFQPLRHPSMPKWSDSMGSTFGQSQPSGPLWAWWQFVCWGVRRISHCFWGVSAYLVGACNISVKLSLASTNLWGIHLCPNGQDQLAWFGVRSSQVSPSGHCKWCVATLKWRNNVPGYFKTLDGRNVRSLKLTPASTNL